MSKLLEFIILTGIAYLLPALIFGIEAEPELKCKDNQLVISARLAEIETQCRNDEVFVQGVNDSCIVQCIIYREGLTEYNGAPNKDKYYKFMDEKAEPKIRKRIEEQSIKCFDQFASEVVPGNCTTSKNFDDCLQKVYNEICK